eukprot:568069-Prymnesium_polylepis.2
MVLVTRFHLQAPLCSLRTSQTCEPPPSKISSCIACSSATSPANTALRSEFVADNERMSPLSDRLAGFWYKQMPSLSKRPIE